MPAPHPGNALPRSVAVDTDINHSVQQWYQSNMTNYRQTFCSNLSKHTLETTPLFYYLE